MRRLAFTMIELIFVIVVMGIVGKFGVEFLAQAYKSFIFSSVNNELQANSEMAVESIAAKLQFRIKDSIIGRRSDNFASFEAVASVPIAQARDYNILEWVGSDIEGFRGDTLPYWSGIIDLDPSKALGSTTFISPETNTTALNTLISILSNTGSGINDAALYFIGSDSDIKTGYGWDGNISGITNQNATMHPINSVVGQPTQFITGNGADFTGVDVFEYYQLAWTAYAVGIDNYDRYDAATNPDGTNTGDLTLWYDYQPWKGERYDDNATNNAAGHVTKSAIIMENVSTFQFKAVGSVIKIQVCANSDLVEDYSLCKEKTIF